MQHRDVEEEGYDASRSAKSAERSAIVYPTATTAVQLQACRRSILALESVARAASILHTGTVLELAELRERHYGTVAAYENLQRELSAYKKLTAHLRDKLAKQQAYYQQRIKHLATQWVDWRAAKTRWWRAETYATGALLMALGRPPRFLRQREPIATATACEQALRYLAAARDDKHVEDVEI